MIRTDKNENIGDLSPINTADLFEDFPNIETHHEIPLLLPLISFTFSCETGHCTFSQFTHFPTIKTRNCSPARPVWSVGEARAD